tara:strand:+ start:3058 stop:3591 length:534 start_codon:yes stop_codon:yes gene_type:complete
MSVLNVLDTQTISGSGTGYITVKSGVVRCLATSASSIQFDAGPAITLAAGEALLLSCGKSKSAQVSAMTDAATAVVTVLGGGTPAHRFVVGDYISTAANSDAAFTSDFVTAASGGKKVTAVTNDTITTDYDSSAASADYALSNSKVAAGTIPVIQRAVKLTAGSADVIVEQVQIVGG